MTITNKSILLSLSIPALLLSTTPALAQTPTDTPPEAEQAGPEEGPPNTPAEPPQPVVAEPAPAPPPPPSVAVSLPPAAPVAPPSVPSAPASKGSFYGKVFANWHYDATDDDAITKKSEVEITRVYLGYKYSIDEHFSTNALLDVERVNPVKTAAIDPTTGAVTTTPDGRYFAYLKFASLDWKDILPYTTLSIGQLGYFAFNVQESFWGKRYLYKMFMDQQGWEPSADMGATVTVVPNEMLKIVAGVVNGEGYKAPQDSNGNYKYGLGLQLKPIKDLTIYAFGDWMPVGSTTSNAQTTFAAFAGYNFQDMFKLSVEYAMQMNQKGTKDHNVNGLSAYGMYSPIEQIELFVRYDLAASKDDFNTTKDGQTIIGGLQYSPVSKVKFALDYQRFMPKPDGMKASNMMYLNCEFDY